MLVMFQAAAALRIKHHHVVELRNLKRIRPYYSFPFVISKLCVLLVLLEEREEPSCAVGASSCLS